MIRGSRGTLASRFAAAPRQTGADRIQAAVVGPPDAERARRRVTASQLAADEDRTRAELVLRENFACGRLGLDELTTRAAQVHEARTIGQLRHALDALPGDPWAPAAISPAAESQARTALLLAVIAVLVPAPPFALGVASAWLALGSLRGGVAVRRGQALAAVAIASVVLLIHTVVLVLWLAGAI